MCLCPAVERSLSAAALLLQKGIFMHNVVWVLTKGSPWKIFAVTQKIHIVDSLYDQLSTTSCHSSLWTWGSVPAEKLLPPWFLNYSLLIIRSFWLQQMCAFWQLSLSLVRPNNVSQLSAFRAWRWWNRKTLQQRQAELDKLALFKIELLSCVRCGLATQCNLM